MDRLFHRLWQEPEVGLTSVGSFAVDVSENNDTLTVEAELPGFSKDQISVSVEQGVLTIEAKREEKADEGQPHLRERTYHVSRRFSLPTAYDTSSVDAKLENGVLTLTLPKREEVKPRRIEVK
jgi:HSP20 family protein